MINHFFKKTLNKFGFNDLSFYAIDISSFAVSIVDFIKADNHFRNENSKKTLFDLFFFGRSDDITKLERIFSANEISELVRHNIIEVNGDKIKSLVRVFFYEKYLFASDFPFRYESSQRVIYSDSKDQVYLPRLDSYYFSNFITDQCSETLDIGTGCGFLAIISSKNSKKVIGVDINKKAIKIANLNKRINNIKNVEFMHGNLFQPVIGLKFDSIISAPPHGINSPVINKPLAVNGGSDGLAVVKKIIKKSKDYLKDKGMVKILMTVGGIDQYEVKINLKKILNKKSKNIFYLIKNFSSFDYSLFNFRNQLITDGLVPTTKKIYNYVDYLDNLKFSRFNAGLLVFKIGKKFSLKILDKPLIESKIKKKIADFFQKN